VTNGRREDRWDAAAGAVGALLSAFVVVAAGPVLLAQLAWIAMIAGVPGAEVLLAVLRDGGRAALSCGLFAGWIALGAFAARAGDWRALRHVQLGPILALCVVVIIAIPADAAATWYSRWQIARYVHSDAPPDEQPRLELYYWPHHFCGNAVSGEIASRYEDTVAALFDDEDPAARARAIQACRRVHDYINADRDGPCVAVFRRALDDPDPHVRALAAAALEGL
jgi:hypothetical protein